MLISNTVPSHMSKWFTANMLVLELYKTNVIQFITNSSSQHSLNIGNEEESVNTTFLGSKSDNHLN
jgi:hypothetical protein